MTDQKETKYSISQSNGYENKSLKIQRDAETGLLNLSLNCTSTSAPSRKTEQVNYELSPMDVITLLSNLNRAAKEMLVNGLFDQSEKEIDDLIHNKSKEIEDLNSLKEVLKEVRS